MRVCHTLEFEAHSLCTLRGHLMGTYLETVITLSTGLDLLLGVLLRAFYGELGYGWYRTLDYILCLGRLRSSHWPLCDVIQLNELRAVTVQSSWLGNALGMDGMLCGSCTGNPTELLLGPTQNVTFSTTVDTVAGSELGMLSGYFHDPIIGMNGQLQCLILAS
jgi:hypothetical protein